MFRRLFRPRRLLALLALLAGLFVAADIVLLRLAESRLATGTARALAAESANSELGTFPFLPSFVGGRAGPIAMNIVGASASGIRVDRVDATAESVLFDPSETFALVRSRFAPRSQFLLMEVEVRVSVIGTDLAEYARARTSELIDIRITSGGIEATFRLPDGTISPPARFFPAVVDNKITLRLTGTSGLPEFAVTQAMALEGVLDLPFIPDDLRSDVELEKGKFVVSLSGSRVPFSFGSSN